MNAFGTIDKQAATTTTRGTVTTKGTVGQCRIGTCCHVNATTFCNSNVISTYPMMIQKQASQFVC